MSRIGRKPIPIPAGVEVKIKGARVEVKGPRGTLEREFAPDFSLVVEAGKILIQRPKNDSRSRAFHGLIRALVANMVTGVSQGFENRLKIMGVGYRASLEGQILKLLVGYSHPVEYRLPEGISAQVEKNTQIILSGIDRQLVGQVAAEIRSIRPPSAYKEKGICYEGEPLRFKPGKTGVSGGGPGT